MQLKHGLICGFGNTVVCLRLESSAIPPRVQLRACAADVGEDGLNPRLEAGGVLLLLQGWLCFFALKLGIKVFLNLKSFLCFHCYQWLTGGFPVPHPSYT